MDLVYRSFHTISMRDAAVKPVPASDICAEKGKQVINPFVIAANPFCSNDLPPLDDRTTPAEQYDQENEVVSRLHHSPSPSLTPSIRPIKTKTTTAAPYPISFTASITHSVIAIPFRHQERLSVHPHEVSFERDVVGKPHTLCEPCSRPV